MHLEGVVAKLSCDKNCRWAYRTWRTRCARRHGLKGCIANSDHWMAFLHPDWLESRRANTLHSARAHLSRCQGPGPCLHHVIQYFFICPESEDLRAHYCLFPVNQLYCRGLGLLGCTICHYVYCIPTWHLAPVFPEMIRYHLRNTIQFIVRLQSACILHFFLPQTSCIPAEEIRATGDKTWTHPRLTTIFMHCNQTA